MQSSYLPTNIHTGSHCCCFVVSCFMRQWDVASKVEVGPSNLYGPKSQWSWRFRDAPAVLRIERGGTMPTQTGEESFFLFFSESSQVVLFWPIGFFQSQVVTAPGDIEDRGQNKGEFFPWNLVGYLRYPSYFGWVGLKCLCAMMIAFGYL